MIDFATKLKGLRESKGWSQDDLAERLGITRSAIGNYEQGTREPDFATLENIADVFNCTICYLLDDTKNSFLLTEFEKDIIRHYRTADEYAQIGVLRLLNMEEKRDISDLSKVANDK